MRWSDWLYARIGRRHSIALDRLAQRLFQYLTEERALSREVVAETLGGTGKKPAAAKNPRSSPHISLIQKRPPRQKRSPQTPGPASGFDRDAAMR